VAPLAAPGARFEGVPHGFAPQPPAGLLRRFCCASPQDGPDAGDQLARRERLGNVVVGAQFEAHHAVYFVAAGRQEHHRYLRAAHRLVQRLEAFEELEAVQVGQSDVQDGQRRRFLRELRNGFFGRGAPDRGESVAFQDVLQRVGDARLVFGNQDPGFEAHPTDVSDGNRSETAQKVGTDRGRPVFCPGGAGDRRGRSRLFFWCGAFPVPYFLFFLFKLVVVDKGWHSSVDRPLFSLCDNELPCLRHCAQPRFRGVPAK
jgi:hypothetical protein